VDVTDGAVFVSGAVPEDRSPWETSAPPASIRQPSPAGVPSVAIKETCRVVGREVPLWRLHRARLAAGGCGESLLADVDCRVAAALASWPDSTTRRARLTVVVGGGGPAAVSIERGYSSLDVPGGPIIARVDVARFPALPTGPVKLADRSAYDAMHRQARRRGAHQAILVGPDGLVIDGSTATVWIAERGVLLTPLSPPAIPGVARAFVLECASAVGIAVHIEPLTWERLDAADEVLLTNAFGGAVPVRGRSGCLSERVSSVFRDAWRY